MIHLYESDQRKDDPDFIENHGSFSVAHINLNKQLKKLGLYAEFDKAKWVGHCDALNLGPYRRDAKNFNISVWEANNCLTSYQVSQARNGTKIFAMSKFVQDLWGKYNIPSELLYCGVDPLVWYPTQLPAREEFVFGITNSSNLRSAYDLIVIAFCHTFGKHNKDVVLKIKDTNDYDGVYNVVQNFQEAGYNIKYCNDRWPVSKMRDFYSSCHCVINLQRAAGFGYTTLESMACGAYCLTGNVAPATELVDSSVATLVNPCGEISIPKFVNKWKLKDCYGPFAKREHNMNGVEPLFWDFQITDIENALYSVYENYTTKSREKSRQYITDKFKWENTTKVLVEKLK